MRHQPLLSSDLPLSQPKPLAVAIRSLIAGGLVFGAGAAPAAADSPLPEALNPAALASSGQASASVTGTAMTINQATNKAVLDWKSFNIDKGYSVEFKQPSSTSIALNNIHQQDASKIFGSLTANGQVYLINQNGFLFGKDSQVNVNALVASTLKISQADFEAGITKVFDLNKNTNNFANSAAALKGNGELFLKNANGEYVKDAAGNKVKIEIFVQQGASIKTRGEGGRVILAAPSITNAGTIETPDGQTILAAATDKVYLQEASDDPNVRGLLVEVGTGGDVNNVGKIIAQRGNASLIGFAVNQKGIASATTSVQLNGSVRLLAREGIQTPSSVGGKLLGKSTKRNSVLPGQEQLGTSATVDLAENSRTSVDLDTDKTLTAIDAQEQTPSYVQVSAHKVYMRNGSLIEAKSGDVELQALDNLSNPAEKGSARIFLDSGAKIDVSGVKNVAQSADSNVVEVELRKNELRDAPLQRDGVLYGKKVKVDIRDAHLVYDADGKLVSAAIPVADIKGAVDRVAKNIDQRSTSGGSISLLSSGDVVAKAGSTLDVSGGSVAYQGGNIVTSNLAAGNRIFNIADADPDLAYDSLFNYQHYSPGYVEGKAGGQLQINAYEALLEGTLQGRTVTGALQRHPEQWAAGSSLLIDLINGNDFSKQNVTFDSRAVVQSLGPTDPIPRRNSGNPAPVALNINPDTLRNAGFRNLTVRANGDLLLADGNRIDLPAGASLDLTARNFELRGSIVAPSGSVNLQPVVMGQVIQPAAIRLAAGASIDVSGLWINDGLDMQQGRGLSPIAIDAGSVNLRSEQRDLIMETGSRIVADGGAWRKANSHVEAGQAGSIVLRAQTHLAGVTPASLILNGNLQAWGLAQGGKLHLESNEVVIGSAGDAPPRAGTAKPLVLAPGFFQQGGFADFDIVANRYGLKVADNVRIELQPRNRQLLASSGAAASGSKLVDVSREISLPEHLRKPVSLNLSYAEIAQHSPGEHLSIGNGASIRTGIGGSVTLNSSTSIFLNGAIDTPAGDIALNIVNPPLVVGFDDTQGIWLGSESRLSAKGSLLRQPSAAGLLVGQVLAGGSVTLAANRGYIVGRAGSQIDVSGSAAELDIPQLRNGRQTYVRQTIASAGGSIELTAGEGMLADAALHAASGGAGAAGGSLTVALDRGLRGKPELPINGSLFPDDRKPNQPYRIEISAADANSVPAGLATGAAIDPALFGGRALFNSRLINAAGFDSLAFETDSTRVGGQLNSGILFKGNVELRSGRQIVLDTPSLQSDGGTVQLNSVYLALGSSQSRVGANTAPAAGAGSGRFTANAKAVDLVGGLAFNGFDAIRINSSGDMRLRGLLGSTQKDYIGRLNVAGDLTLQANQLYPGTLTEYLIDAGSRSVTFLNSVASQTPVYSAGGSLTVNAANIYQRGTLKAPFGSLTLNAANTLQLAAGSVTSVSADGLLVPFGRGSGGTDWLYPLDAGQTANIVVNAPPEKSLHLTGTDVDLQQGALIDLSGGGDLYAYEFIPGPGGSKDALAAGNGSFAVLPGFNSSLTPYDPLESAGSGLHNGDSVYLAAGSGLAEGWYTLLPARYALLPGAYLVTPVAGSQDAVVNTTNNAGSPVVVGRYGVAGTAIADNRSSSFLVEPGAIARTRSQYIDYYAGKFFSDKAAAAGQAAPQLPGDAGSLVLSAQRSLKLAAELAAQPALRGVGGQVDITGNRLAVVGNSADLAGLDSGTVGLLASDLNKFNAPSLLLGGQRSKEAKGQRLTVSTNKLTVAGNAVLQGQEILLAATDLVQVAAGAQLLGVGSAGQGGGQLLVSNAAGGSDGALLRVAAGGQAEVSRDQTVSGNRGELVVDAGALIKTSGSALLDATKNTVFDGSIDMAGAALALNAGRISIGAAPANTPGLVLANTAFDLKELRLNSRGDFDIYGGVDLNVDNLLISAAAINGFANQGAAANINADSIVLTNLGASSNRSGSGNGTLNLNADDIRLGAGSYRISGFDNVNFKANAGIGGIGQIVDPATGNSRFADPGKLKVAGNLTLDAAYIGGGNGATTSIDAGGYRVDLLAGSALPAQLAPGLGGQWSITGDSIQGSGRFLLPSGSLSLQALNGPLVLESGSVIDLSGRALAFADTVKYSAGGNLALLAGNGDVVLKSGTQINLGGGQRSVNGATYQAADAGRMLVSAVQGKFDWQGAIDGKSALHADANFKQASLALDVKDLGDISTLSAKLAQAGFAEQVALKQRSGNIVLNAGNTLSARQLVLEADQGAVTIAGTLNASAAKAGSIDVYGRNGINLAATGRILAQATASGESGGQVTLDTLHRDDAGSGLLDLSAAGGLIDLSGAAGASGGALHLRSGRNGNQVNISAIDATITGADPLRSAVEAVRVYAGVSTITSDHIATWRDQTAEFMQNRPVLSGLSAANLELLPGIEVRSSGNLTLADNWDFMAGQWADNAIDWQSDWRYGDRQLPGFLTLRAAGQLNVNASLSDAFANTSLPGQEQQDLEAALGSKLLSKDLLQPGLSWSYKLIAGQDVNLAAARGAEQVKVRTGTGSIDIDAGGSIRFLPKTGDSQAAAAVYTMGTAALYSRNQLLNGEIPGIPAQNAGESVQNYLARLSPEQLNRVLRYGLLDQDSIVQGIALYAEFPTQGGNIGLRAGGDISGIQTGQSIGDWLVRDGQWQAGSDTNQATAWGINISGNRDFEQLEPDADGNMLFAGANRYFNQNVGALAGGNVNVVAGGNINNLSVMIPTTGKPLGTIDANGRWLQTGTYINGGGDLSVVAGNDIVAGEFYTGRGRAELIAGGSIAKGAVPGSAQSVGVMLDVGDAEFQVRARRDIELAAALSPTALKQKIPSFPGDGVDSRFFSYTAHSAVNLTSIAGNLFFQNDYDAIKAVKKLSSNDGSGFEYFVYPATLRAAALSGDVRINGSMTLFPDAAGDLELLANGNIGSDTPLALAKKISVNMSDTDPALLPGIANPARNLDGDYVSGNIQAQQLLDANSPKPATIHAAVPVHLHDQTRPLIVAKTGSIGFAAGLEATFHMPQAASFIAGRDINNLSVNGQNLSSSDATLIMAGGNINFDTVTDSNGNVVFTRNNPQFFRLGGPGHLQVVAGGDVVLGSSGGIQTVGNLLNPGLGNIGASIDLLAGTAGGIDLAGFADKYRALYPEWLNGLDNLTSSESQRYLGNVLAVLFTEIDQSAKAAAAAGEGQRAAQYKRGFDAIQALFPNAKYSGDVSLVFSAVKTLAGGSINIAVPGGKLDVGLTGKKAADELGIVVQQAGNLNIFTRDNVNVNQSRVFTLGGGNIVAWSSKGDIDAGKGAKSALSAPKPITSVDANGNIVTVFPPIISGSGIQAIGGGNVTLAAPEGVVDAGEAGISGGDITIAATAVIGASNIQASGTSTGVPTAVAAPVVPTGADSAAAGAARSAGEAPAAGNKDADGKNGGGDKKAPVAVLSTDIVGYGQCSVGDIRDGKAGCGG